MIMINRLFIIQTCNHICFDASKMSSTTSNMQGIMQVFSALLPNVYSGTADKIMCASSPLEPPET